MRIEKLYLNEIGPFEKLQLEFPKCGNKEKAEIHIFTGPNGVGKSTILYALASVLSSNDYFNILKRIKDKNSSVCEILFENNEIIILSSLSDLKSQLIVNSPLQFIDKNPYLNKYTTIKGDGKANVYTLACPNYLPYSKDYKFSFAAFAYSGYRTISSSNLNTIQEMTDNPFNNSLSFTSSYDSAQLFQWLALTFAKEALSEKQHNQLKADKFRGSIDRIQKAIQKITGLDIKFTLDTEPFGLKLKLITSEEPLNFDVLPDGLKSIISWIGDLSMRMDLINWYDNNIDIFERNFILFLDEIDIHLHPKWQRKILPAVQELFPNAQIFVSTHSPFVVNSVSDAKVYSFDMVDNKSILKSVEDSKAGYSYEYVVEDIFGVKELFDLETEDLFKEFYELREKMLDNKNIISADENKKFIQLANILASKGTEIRDIIGREIRQLVRITGRDIEL
ncbi:MAG: AAA family ATPase [Nitrospirae bacterium]|nr:AAA family ATPase [Nitrospirota bacterium]